MKIREQYMQSEEEDTLSYDSNHQIQLILNACLLSSHQVSLSESNLLAVRIKCNAMYNVRGQL